MAETSTRRKPGPPKTKDYTTVSLKIPTALLAHVKRYARQHQRPVSELFRDGVAWRIGDGDLLTQRYATGAHADQAYIGNTEIPDAGQGDTEPPDVLQAILTALARQETQLHALAQALEQRPGTPLSGAYSSHTTKRSTRLRSTPELAPAGHRRQASQATLEARGNTVLQNDAPSFDTSKYVLGKLCPRGHAHGTTGQSLLRISNRHCLACDREKWHEKYGPRRQAKQPPPQRRRRQAKRQAQPA